MGEVYKASDRLLDPFVALKVMRADVGDDDAFCERFRREGRNQARLTHPHIVTVIEANEQDGLLYIAMALIPGGRCTRRSPPGRWIQRGRSGCCARSPRWTTRTMPTSSIER